jgi:hypothetical protein
LKIKNKNKLHIIHIKKIKVYGDTPPNFLKDPNVGPIIKQQKNKKVRAHSSIHNISKVKGRVKISRWD